MSQTRRPLDHFLFHALATLGMLLFLTTPAAAQCDSLFPNGDFNTPTDWSCNFVPGPTTVARIFPGHTMTSTTSVSVDSLEIWSGGRFVMNGFPLQIELVNLTISPGGELRSTANSNIYVTSPFNVPFMVINDGLVQAGAGGDVFFHDGGPGGDLPCPQGSTIMATNGSFEAGAPDGNVYLLADTIILDNTLVQAGSGNVPYNFFCQSTAGSVYIAGVTVSLLNGTQALQGLNSNPGPPPLGCPLTALPDDGSVKVIGQDCFTGNGTLIIDNSTVGQTGANQCATIFATTTILNGATINSGGTGCIYWDPPELYLAGDSELSAGDIVIAGEVLDATGLASRTLPTPAVQAGDRLEIRLPPGGELDLTGLAPGFEYFQAGSQITLCVDEDRIHTDPGVELSDLMSPAPEIERPKHTLVVTLNPGGQHLVNPGSSVEHPMVATSLSTTTANVEVYTEDSKGWLVGGPAAQSANLDPGEAILRTLTINVPSTAAPGDTTIVKTAATIASQDTETAITIYQVPEKNPCGKRGCKGSRK